MENRLTKKQRRMLRQQDVLEKDNTINTDKFNVDFKPKTRSQEAAVNAWDDGHHLLMHGYAGTGKTYVAMALALQEVMRNHYKKVVIVRSAVPTRDIGFLPGTAKQKMEVYELPYKQIASSLFHRGDAYEILNNKFMLEFIPTSYVRGTTLDNCIVLVDEINNMTFHEIDSVITRLGDNTRCILCGDYRQSDLTNTRELSGISQFMSVVNNMNSFVKIEYTTADIVRSPLVKEYIITKATMGIV